MTTATLTPTHTTWCQGAHVGSACLGKQARIELSLQPRQDTQDTGDSTTPDTFSASIEGDRHDSAGRPSIQVEHGAGGDFAFLTATRTTHSRRSCSCS
ncbi:hypothetical protein [Lapillicoccus sp.]|uniref:hypothetical protein n=1 Tax=Lapillicoccus sp. TaxID=1909287 RepID=UPI0025DBBA1C|nr:hypothetical protein [Lapillicoccus sp.]